jgi:hypothetical protein
MAGQRMKTLDLDVLSMVVADADSFVRGAAQILAELKI